MFGTVTSKLKYFKRTNMYKNSTGNCTFDPSQIEAWSYKWWKFVSKENGLVIFNDYNYSPTTNAHQSVVRDVLKELKIKIDITVYSAKGLQSYWKTEVFSNIYEELFLNEYKMNKKGMSKRTKDNCLGVIKNCEKQLKKLKSKIKCPISKMSLNDLKKSVINDYESELKENRENRKLNNEKRKKLVALSKDKFNDLNSLKLYDNYDKLNNMGEI